MKKISFLLLILLTISSVSADNPQWARFFASPKVNATVHKGNISWFGTYDGLIKLNRTTGEKTFYNTANSGISQNEIQDLAIDSSNVLWLITSYKLMSFNGSDWTVYPKPDSLASDNEGFTKIAIDSMQNKWIGNYYGNLYKVSGTSWNVYHYENKCGGDVASIAIDKEQNVWLGVSKVGLLKFDGTNWSEYITGALDLYFFSICFDNNNNQWVATASGLAKIDSSGCTLYTTANSGLLNDWIRSVCIDNQQNKWLTASNGGLIKFDDTNWTIYNSGNSGVASNFFHSVTIDEEQNKWVVSNEGDLQVFDGNNWTIEKIGNSDIPSKTVYSIDIDNNNNKWIGTNKGLAKFDDMNWLIYDKTNSGLLDNNINSVTIDSAQNKWLGTSNGVAMYNGTSWTVYNSTNSMLDNQGVYSIVIDNQQNKWIASLMRMYKLDNYGVWSAPAFLDNTTTLAIDSSQNIWVSNGEGDLVKYDGTNFTVYPHPAEFNYFPYINSIIIDANQNVWALFPGNGLAMFNGTSWITYTYDSTGIGLSYITSSVIDNNQNIWIGSDGGGLYKFDGQNWTAYTKDNSGLPDNRVNSLKFDANNNLWIGTEEAGLAVFNETGIVSIGENTQDNLPKNLTLNQNYPNPFNPNTQISFNLQNSSYISLKIYDLCGREIATLINGILLGGKHSYNFNASRFASGVYFYKLQSGSNQIVKKMILQK